jgi:hypothetical protein
MRADTSPLPKQTNEQASNLGQTYFKRLNLKEKKGLGKEMKQDVFSA